MLADIARVPSKVIVPFSLPPALDKPASPHHCHSACSPFAHAFLRGENYSLSMVSMAFLLLCMTLCIFLCILEAFPTSADGTHGKRADRSSPHIVFSCQHSKPSNISCPPQARDCERTDANILPPCLPRAIVLNREMGMIAILASEGCNEMTQVRDSEQWLALSAQ